MNRLSAYRSTFAFAMFFLALIGTTKSFAQVSVQECNGAIPVCDSIYFEGQSYVGEGNIVDVPSTGGPANTCLGQSFASGQAEINSVWYQFSVLQTGTFEMDIIPNVFADDYDWQMWNITTMTCADIAADINPSVSCNFSGADGPTGVGSPAPGGTAYQPAFIMTAGETYVLLINNWSDSPNGYTLDLTDATAVFNYTPTVIDTSEIRLYCGDTIVPFFLDGKVQCGSVSPDGSDFRMVDSLGNTIPIKAAVPVNCTPLYTNQINIILYKPLAVNTQYHVFTKKGNDFNVLLANCTEVPEFDSIAYRVVDCYDFDVRPKLVNVTVVNDSFVRAYWLDPFTQGLDSNFFTSYKVFRGERSMGTSLGGLQPISSGLTARYDTIYDDTDALNVDAVSYSYAMEYKVDWPSNRVLRSDTLGSILFYDRDAELSQSVLVNPNLFWTPYMGWPNPTYVLNQSLDGLPYNWTPVDTTQDTTLLYSRPTAAGDYVLKITTTNGIYTSESNFLKFGVVPPPVIPPVVIRPVIIPNVFTPNADGINDVFRITNIEDYGASKLTIVNRWGVSVYESDNYQNAWDGGDAIPGEYFYIIELGSGGGLFSGQVKLIR